MNESVPTDNPHRQTPPISPLDNPADVVSISIEMASEGVIDGEKLDNALAIISRERQDLEARRDDYLKRADDLEKQIVLMIEASERLMALPTKGKRPKAELPPDNLKDAVRRIAPVLLPDFNRDELAQAMKSKFPALRVSERSLEKPVLQLAATGELIETNAGSKKAKKRYRWVKSSLKI
jgi:hypothetical protein